MMVPLLALAHSQGQVRPSTFLFSSQEPVCVMFTFPHHEYVYVYGAGRTLTSSTDIKNKTKLYNTQENNSAAGSSLNL